MAEEETQRTEECLNTEHSTETEHPAPSAEERALVEGLLKNSTHFIRLYEEDVPELQQMFTQLTLYTEDFMDDHGGAVEKSRGWIYAAALGIGVGVAVGLVFAFVGASLVSFTGTLSGLVEMAVMSAIGTGALTATGVYSSNTNWNTNHRGRRLLEESEKTVEKFNTTAERFRVLLKNISIQLEKILQSQTLHEDLREAFNPKYLLFFSTQLQVAGETTKNISEIPPPADLQLRTEDSKTQKDFNKLSILFTLQEDELESPAGRLVWRSRQAVAHFQDMFCQISGLKSELEKRIIPNLIQYLHQP